MLGLGANEVISVDFQIYKAMLNCHTSKKAGGSSAYCHTFSSILLSSSKSSLARIYMMEDVSL